MEMPLGNDAKYIHQPKAFSALLLVGEAGLDVGDRTVDLAEPMRRAGRQDDEIARLKVPRLAAGNARGPVLSAFKRSAGHERAGTADDVVNLGQVVMHACVVGTVLPASDDDLAGAGFDDGNGLSGDDA